MADKTNLHLLVDGIEYDPGFGDFQSFYTGGASPINTLGLAGNDSAVVRHIDVQLDYFRVGSSGYGSTEYFSDDFSGTGFPLWDAYNPGSPGTYLTEGSGIAHLAFTADLIGNPDISKDLTASGRNLYWLTAVKCSFPATTAPGSPGYTLWQSGSTFRMKYYNNAIVLEAGSLFRCDNTPVVLSYTHSINLNDGNWHAIGLHFRAFAPCVAPPEGYPVFRSRWKAA